MRYLCNLAGMQVALFVLEVLATTNVARFALDISLRRNPENTRFACDPAVVLATFFTIRVLATTNVARFALDISLRRNPENTRFVRPTGIVACMQAAFLSLIHISEPTRRTPISYAVFCLK